MNTRVFIVEDEAIVAMELEARLRAMGYEVCGQTARGEAALRQIPRLRPDLILMDVNLAGAVSGLEVAEQLAALHDVPVIFLTAYSDDELTARAARTGSYAYVVKPFDPNVLKTNIELVLDRHALARRLRELNERLEELVAQRTAELDRTRGRLEFLLTASPVVIYTRPASDARVTAYVSDNIRDVFGYEARRCVETLNFWGQHVHPDDEVRALAAVRAVHERGTHREEYRFRRADGTWRWIRDEVRLIRDGAGEPVELVGAITDIHDQKLVELAVATERRRLASIVESTNVGTWEWNIQTDELRVNERWAAIVGSSREELAPLTGTSSRQLTHPDDRARANDLLMEHFDGEQRQLDVETRVRHQDGRWVWVQDQGRVLTRTPAGEPEMMYGIRGDITGRKRMELTLRDINAELELRVAERSKALRASERRFRRLFMDAIEGIFRMSLDGTMLDANPAFARMLGYDEPDQLIGRSASMLDEHAGVITRLRAWPKDQDAMHGVKLTWRSRLGEQRLVELHVRRLRDEGGAPSHFQGYARDVTAQRQFEAALRVLSTGLAELTGPALYAELARQLAQVVDADIAFVTTSEREDHKLHARAIVVDGVAVPPDAHELAASLQELCSGQRSTVIAANAAQLVPEARALAHLHVEALIAAPLVDGSGRIYGCAGVMARRPIQHPERVLSVAELFARRAASEIARQRAEERFASVFEYAPDALLIVDETGRIVQASRMSEKTLGYSRDELLTLRVEDLINESARRAHEQHRRAFLDASSRGVMGATRPQLRALRKDGTHVPVEISLSPFETDAGRLVVTAVRDVSERVRAETQHARLQDQLRQAQKMESLGTLAGGIAHDFNNLLAAINGHVALARVSEELTEPLALHIDGIATACGRATSLAKNILAFARKKPSARVVTALGEVVQEAVSLLRPGIPAGVRIVAEIADDAPRVRADPNQIHQVLMNLGTNAWQAIKRGSGGITFRLTSELVEDCSQRVGLAAGRYALIQVIDDGEGMDEATRARVFDPFFTTKDVGEGTGLGLSVVHGIITDHGGALRVASARGRGTTMSVYLPESSATPAAPARSSPAALRPGAGRVLIIEDDPMLLRVETLLIEHLGYKVTGFERPTEALATLRQDPKLFDVVLTDENMPGLDGLEVARIVGELRPELPVVLVSGDSRRKDEPLASNNVRRFLNKPYEYEEFSEVLAQLCVQK